MRFDYNFKHYDFRLVLYMIVLNIFGVLVMRSAVGAESFRDVQVVRQILGSFAGLAISFSLFQVSAAMRTPRS